MGNTAAAPYIRKAKYAGRLYPDDEDALTLQLQEHLHEANQASLLTPTAPEDEKYLPSLDDRPVRALMAPHSFHHCEAARVVSAYAYKYLNPVSLRHVRTILVLHPHHFTVSDQPFAAGKCLLTNAVALETPLGHLTVDDHLRQEILSLSTDHFMLLSKGVDEQEHSGELQYIWIAHCLKLAFQLDTIRVLPIMMGDLKTTDEIEIGTLLARILHRPHVLTVISTEFCRWGRHHHAASAADTSRHPNKKLYYQPWDPSMKPHEFIAKLDWHGLHLIRDLQAAAFASYLLETENNISGRHAIAVWLRAMAASANNDKDDNLLSVVCTKYAQSCACETPADASVSYAAVVATTTTTTTTENSNK